MEYELNLSDSHFNEENLVKAGFKPDEGEITVTVTAEVESEDNRFSAHNAAGSLQTYGGDVAVWKSYELINEAGDDIKELLNEKGVQFVSASLDAKVEGLDPESI